jgi:hypothetical protein
MADGNGNDDVVAFAFAVAVAVALMDLCLTCRTDILPSCVGPYQELIKHSKDRKGRMDERRMSMRGCGPTETCDRWTYVFETNSNDFSPAAGAVLVVPACLAGGATTTAPRNFRLLVLLVLPLRRFRRTRPGPRTTTTATLTSSPGATTLVHGEDAARRGAASLHSRRGSSCGTASEPHARRMLSVASSPQSVRIGSPTVPLSHRSSLTL